MNTLKKFFDMPPVEGFDALKESRRCKRALGRRLAGMTGKERLAYFQKVHEEYAAEQAARKELAPA